LIQAEQLPDAPGHEDIGEVAWLRQAMEPGSTVTPAICPLGEDGGV
jgi:hypothetical protein